MKSSIAAFWQHRLSPNSDPPDTTASVAMQPSSSPYHQLDLATRQIMQQVRYTRNCSSQEFAHSSRPGMVSRDSIHSLRSLFAFAFGLPFDSAAGAGGTKGHQRNVDGVTCLEV